MWAAVPFRVFYVLAFPFIWTLKGAAVLVLKMLRLPPASEAEMLHSPDELRLVVQHVQLDPGARRLIDRVFDYTHRVARHVMTLRRDVVTLEAGRPVRGQPAHRRRQPVHALSRWSSRSPTASSATFTSRTS